MVGVQVNVAQFSTTQRHVTFTVCVCVCAQWLPESSHRDKNLDCDNFYCLAHTFVMYVAQFEHRFNVDVYVA